MNVVDIRYKLADAINRVAYAGERIVLERRGKGVAALVSLALRYRVPRHPARDAVAEPAAE